ncbi:hypothetical protein [Streptomyces sp. NPDC056061]|uniref:hypothetical protein n=1 Tax=Streptomyces sp. NPDC056061 TaxID=3345700 RepID=UPI0035E38E3A
MTTTKPENPYAQAYASFLAETRNHQLVVLHEDGVYRHLRIQAPGTRAWSWDISTWPGHLATSGDIADGYMFAREHDMVEFFSHAGRRDGYYSDGAPSIDVRYWAEKLCGGRSHEVKKYEPKVFLQHIKDWLSEDEELGDEAQRFHEQQHALLCRLYELRGLGQATLIENLEAHWAPTYRPGLQGRDATKAAKDRLWSTDGLSGEQSDQLAEEFDWVELGDTEIKKQSPAEERERILGEATLYAAESEHEAREWLRDDAEAREIFGEDAYWESDFRTYDVHFLFTCYCIDLGVRLYHEHVEKHGVNDTYVLVQDDRVANRPSQPVIDLGVLDYSTPDAHTARDALLAREQIMTVPQARKELPEAVEELTALVRSHGDTGTLERLNAALTKEHDAVERAVGQVGSFRE